MKQADYFQRFKDIECPRKVLWVDDDIMNDTPIGKAIKSRIGIIDLAKGTDLIFCGQEDVESMLESGIYSLAVIDCDSRQVMTNGYSRMSDPVGTWTVNRLKRAYSTQKDPHLNIPILFVTSNVEEYFLEEQNSESGFRRKELADKVSGVVGFHELAWNLPDFIERYSRW